MALSNEFKEAVKQEKETIVKIMLKDSLLLDKTFKDFEEKLNYANSKMGNLFESHDGEQFKLSTDWNEDYLNEEMVAVVNNFSKERIELLKSIVSRIYFRENDEILKASRNDESLVNTSNLRRKISGTKIAGGATALVGAGLLIGGLVVADTPIIVPVIGGVAVGAGSLLFFKK